MGKRGPHPKIATELTAREEARRRAIIGTPLAEKELARFWAKVDRSAGVEACWPWTGARSTAGYGQLMMRSRKTGAFTPTYAHRLALWIANGVEPIFGLHECDNPSCCNVHPKHVREGTQSENLKGAVERGRVRFPVPPPQIGEGNNRAILTEADVRAIRASEGGTSALARVFGVSEKAIWNVRAQRTWKHVR